MNVIESQRFQLASRDDGISRLRVTVRRLAREAGFSVVDQTRLMTAASEIARNSIVHGEGGNAVVQLLERGREIGIRVIFEDTGPGIADLDEALRDGFTSGKGLGLGLGGTRRLVGNLEIENRDEGGLRVSFQKWRNA